MSRKILALVATIAAVLLTCWAGCHGPYKARSDDEKPLEHTESVVLMDEDLEDWLRIETQEAQYTADGRLQAYCELRNRTEDDLAIQVQTVFKDGQGMATGDLTSWQTLVIPDNSIHYYETTALSRESQRYVIRIKLAD